MCAYMYMYVCTRACVRAVCGGGCINRMVGNFRGSKFSNPDARGAYAHAPAGHTLRFSESRVRVWVGPRLRYIYRGINRERLSCI